MRKFKVLKSVENLSFESLAWASLFYHHTASTDEENGYRTLLDSTVISTLRTNPADLAIEQVKDEIISKFLNKWGCRLAKKNHDFLAEKIIKVTGHIKEDLQSLSGAKLIDIDLASNKTAIKNCYQAMVGIGHGFSHTAASKLLHMISPELFVMWDGPMREGYRKHYDITADAAGYFNFMKKMQEGLQKVSQSFLVAYEGCPAGFLSKKLEINPPKTLVKHLDEYNWITITKEVNLPPTWHPALSSLSRNP